MSLPVTPAIEPMPSSPDDAAPCLIGGGRLDRDRHRRPHFGVAGQQVHAAVGGQARHFVAVRKQHRRALERRTI